ncbi:MAG: hypothetical protein Q7U66_14220 [Methylobacter sp.]|nr:hypothetical protein [Methylobacter sp.]
MDTFLDLASDTFDEDDLVAALKNMSCAPHMVSRLRRWLIPHMDREMHKAYWAYVKAAERLNMPYRATFELEYLESWADYYLHAATAVASDASTLDGAKERTILLTWHHPEAPLLMAKIQSLGALTLIAQEARWMLELMGAGNTLLFRNPSSGISLLKAFRKGQTIACMMDYCYDETVNVKIPFLGYQAATPAGLLMLASRFGYQIDFISYKNNSACIIASTHARNRTAEDLAVWINALLEHEIIAEPTRWLLWPSVDRRWRGVQYEHK